MIAGIMNKIVRLLSRHESETFGLVPDWCQVRSELDYCTQGRTLIQFINSSKNYYEANMQCLWSTIFFYYSLYTCTNSCNVGSFFVYNWLCLIICEYILLLGFSLKSRGFVSFIRCTYFLKSNPIYSFFPESEYYNTSPVVPGSRKDIPWQFTAALDFALPSGCDAT